MENPILAKRKLVQDRINKSFDNGINVPEMVEMEKAHQDGEMHPNGKWVWVSSANGGKGDWRTKGGRTHNANSENEKKFKQNFKDTKDELLKQIVDGKIQAGAHEKKWAQDILDERKKGVEGNKAAKKIIDLMKISSSKYSDISKVVAFKTDKGNWAIDYDGANTGLVLNGNSVSEADLKAAGVKLEGVKSKSAVKIDETTINQSEYDSQLKIAKQVDDKARSMAKNIIQGNIDKTKKELQEIISSRPGAKATIAALQKDLTKFISQKKAVEDASVKTEGANKVNDTTIDQSVYDSTYKIATSKEETESHLRESLQKIDKNIMEVKNAISSASSATLGKLQKMLTTSVSKKKAIEDALKNFKKADPKQDKAAQDAGFKDYEEMKGWQDYTTAKNLLKKPSMKLKSKEAERKELEKQVADYEKDHADVIAARSGKKNTNSYSSMDIKDAKKALVGKVVTLSDYWPDGRGGSQDAIGEIKNVRLYGKNKTPIAEVVYPNGDKEDIRLDEIDDGKMKDSYKTPVTISDDKTKLDAIKNKIASMKKTETKKTNDGNFNGMKFINILDSLDEWDDDDWNNQELNDKLTEAIKGAIKKEGIDEKKFNVIAKMYPWLDLVYENFTGDPDDDFAKLLNPLDNWSDDDWNDDKKNKKLSSDIKGLIMKHKMSESDFKKMVKKYQGLDLVYTDYVPSGSELYKKYNGKA